MMIFFFNRSILRHHGNISTLVEYNISYTYINYAINYSKRMPRCFAFSRLKKIKNLRITKQDSNSIATRVIIIHPLHSIFLNQKTKTKEVSISHTVKQKRKQSEQYVKHSIQIYLNGRRKDGEKRNKYTLQCTAKNNNNKNSKHEKKKKKNNNVV